MKLKAILLVYLFASISVYSDEVKESQYDLSICAIFKNESAYLKEWIEYHKLIGVDHFYLYNNNSTDNFLEVLTPYFNEGLITLINWPDCLTPCDDAQEFIWPLSTQISAYENAIKVTALYETKWLVFVDVDEFLIPINSNRLSDLLKNYEQYPGVVLSSTFFDASKNETLFPKRKLLIETVELTHNPVKKIQTQVSKTIFKPELCTSFTWPPYRVNFKDDQAPITIRKQEMRINHYVNRNKEGLFSGKIRDRLHVDHRMIPEYELEHLLEEGYEIQDQEKCIHRFVPEMIKKMGFDAVWECSY